MMACMYGMVGYYANSSGVTDTVWEHAYVTDGVARLGSSPFFGTYWTSLHTWSSIPWYCYLLPNTVGDTLAFSVRLKNPTTGSGSVSAWDVGLFMVGDQNTAGVSLIGNTLNQHYTYLRVGSEDVVNQASLVRTFDNWTVVKLQAVKIPGSTLHTLSVSLDGTIIQSINYDPVADGIGQISRFEISFKGSGSVDWFRVSGSGSGTGLLRNEFDDMSFWSGLEWY
ncbi:hypothetical protein [Chitinophaga cymbidii]|nr:hypothetical protein [Chitinophaga cymbidii]